MIAASFRQTRRGDHGVQRGAGLGREAEDSLEQNPAHVNGFPRLVRCPPNRHERLHRRVGDIVVIAVQQSPEGLDRRRYRQRIRSGRGTVMRSCAPDRLVGTFTMFPCRRS